MQWTTYNTFSAALSWIAAIKKIKHMENTPIETVIFPLLKEHRNFLLNWKWGEPHFLYFNSLQIESMNTALTFNAKKKKKNQWD